MVTRLNKPKGSGEVKTQRFSGTQPRRVSTGTVAVTHLVSVLHGAMPITVSSWKVVRHMCCHVRGTFQLLSGMKNRVSLYRRWTPSSRPAKS